MARTDQRHQTYTDAYPPGIYRAAAGKTRTEHFHKGALRQSRYQSGNIFMRITQIFTT